MKTWVVTFDNMGEYIGGILVKCERIRQVDSHTIEADGVLIDLGSEIYSIKESETELVVGDL